MNSKKDTSFHIVVIGISVMLVIALIYTFVSAMNMQNKIREDEQTQAQTQLVEQFESAYATMSDAYTDKVARNVSVDGNEVATSNVTKEATTDMTSEVSVSETPSQPSILVANETTIPDTHHIIWGDTLSGISDTYGVSVDKLANLNQIRNVNLIYANSSLQLK